MPHRFATVRGTYYVYIVDGTRSKSICINFHAFTSLWSHEQKMKITPRRDKNILSDL